VNQILMYYDSLKNEIWRPYNEYPQLNALGDIQNPKPEFYQEEGECVCMVILRLPAFISW